MSVLLLTLVLCFLTESNRSVPVPGKYQCLYLTTLVLRCLVCNKEFPVPLSKYISSLSPPVYSAHFALGHCGNPLLTVDEKE